MNYRTYLRNVEALYTMELIVSELEGVGYGSTQKVGNYIGFDTIGHFFRVEFRGHKYNMTKFYAAKMFIFIMLDINCDINSYIARIKVNLR